MFSVVEMFMMSSMRCLETGSPRLITMTDFMVDYESSSSIRATKWTKMAKGRLEDKMRYVSDHYNKIIQGFSSTRLIENLKSLMNPI